MDRAELLKAGWTEKQIYLLFERSNSYDSDESYEYQDNHRWARCGNTEEEYQYDIQVSHGCCGSVDDIIPCEDGNIMYGFNYGH